MLTHRSLPDHPLLRPQECEPRAGLVSTHLTQFLKLVVMNECMNELLQPERHERTPQAASLGYCRALVSVEMRL